MFTKLISNLPYSPSLVQDIGEYRSHIQQESKLRKLGLISISIAALLYGYTLFFGAEASLLSSPGSDIIQGGTVATSDNSTNQSLVEAISNSSDAQAAYDYYNISTDDILNASMITIESNENQYRITTRQSIAQGAETCTLHEGLSFCERSLNRTYEDFPQSIQVLAGSRSETESVLDPWFGIIPESGNIITRSTESTSAELFVHRHSQSTPNEEGVGTFAVSLVSKEASPILNPTVDITLPDTVSLIDYQPKDMFTSATVEDNVVTLTSINALDGFTDASPAQIVFWVEYLQPETLGNELCVDARFSSSTTNASNADQPCISLTDEAETNAIPIQYTTVQLNDDDSSQTQTTKAQSGDSLEFNFHLSNESASSEENTISVGVADLLEYAEITELHGGSLDEETSTVTWSNLDTSTSNELQQSFLATIRDPLPSTPVAATNPRSFNNKIELGYGNNISVELPSNFTKNVESVTAKLPHLSTAQGLSAAIFVLLTSSYFYARSRVIDKELTLIRDEFSGKGDA